MKKIYTLTALWFSLNAGAQDIDIYGPEPFVDILDNSFVKAWTPAALSAINDRDYFVLLDTATKLKVIALDGTRYR